MSYKFDDIDYSKNDFIDINNRLFRLGRNKMSENSIPLKELDSENKATGEKNLSIYGVELVNNLKQINYTFRQLEDYVFVPAKNITKRGPKTIVEDIRKPPPPPPPTEYNLEFDFSSAKEGETKEETGKEEFKDDIELYYDYTKDIDDFEAIKDLGQLKDEGYTLRDRIYRLEQDISKEIYKEGEIAIDDIFSDKYIDDNYETFSNYLKELYKYHLLLSNREKELQELIKTRTFKSSPDVEEYEKLKKAYDIGIADLAEKFEAVSVKIPPEGISPPFVEENKEVLDDEGLSILEDVKEIGKLLTQAEPEPLKEQTETIFTDPYNPDIEYLKDYTFLDDSKTYTPEQIKNNKVKYEAEYDKIQKLSDEEDINRRGTKTINPAYNALVGYQYKLSTEGPKYLTFETLKQGSQAEGLTKVDKTKIKPSEFPKTVKKLNTFKSIFTKDSNFSITTLRDNLKLIGFTNVNPANYPTKDSIFEAFKEYERRIEGLHEGEILKTGAGRYIGGAKTPKKAQLLLAQAQQTTPATATPAIPAQSTPVIIDKEEADEWVDEKEVEREQITNADLSKKLQKDTTILQNTNQKSPLPAYQNKIDELMTGLIQFIGRTTVLFISKIKKNLKYLDEDLNKQITDEITKFKRNLEILRNFKNKSSVLIKSTLYNQVEKETIGLYNEINDSIRNFSKLKSYTSLDSLQGGYFIQSDSPFIRHSTTKRFF